MRDDQLAILVFCRPGRRTEVLPLVAMLSAGGRFAVEVSSDNERLSGLDGVKAVYFDSTAAPLTSTQAQRLTGFVAGGGGVVAAGETLARWNQIPTIAELAGWSPDGRTVDTELVIRDAEGERVLGSLLRVRATVHLLPQAPAGARPLLVTQWRYQDQVVAYSREVSAGRFVYLGLQGDHAYRDPAVQRLVRETLALVTDPLLATRTMGVGLLGFGVLGPAHLQAIADVDGLDLRCVCDRAADRLAQADSLGVDTLADARQLYARSDVDVVLVGTPPWHHAEASLAALAAGKHVVSEKPFALTVADCDRVIERARAVDRLVTVYQNRRWDPDYVAIRSSVEDGAVGTPFSIETFVGGFGHPCHFWHSHEPISGGAIFDWGAHYIDWILELFRDRVTSVACIAHKRVWHDVTNADHISVEMRFAGGMHATFIHSDIAAARKPKWYLLGTDGAIVADWQSATTRVVGPDGEIDEEQVSPTDLPARVRVIRPSYGGGTSEQVLALPQRNRLAFYRNLAAHLRTGEPLAVTAEQARRTVAVMETATRSAALGGAPIATDI